jgi:hypothetical protein
VSGMSHMSRIEVYVVRFYTNEIQLSVEIFSRDSPRSRNILLHEKFSLLKFRVFNITV